MNEDEFEVLSPREKTQRIVSAIRGYAPYGLSATENVKKSAIWAATFSRLAEAAKRKGSQPPLDVNVLMELNEPVESETAARGWFIRQAQKRVQDKRSKTWSVEAEGPLVLLEDGSLKPVFNGQDMREHRPIVTKVTVAPVRRTRNLLFERQEVKIDKGAKVAVTEEHDAPFPTLTLEAGIKKCFEVQGGEKSRGVIRGDSGDNPLCATLTIGSEQDVSFFEKGSGGRFAKKGEEDDERLKVIAADALGNRVSLKPDPQDVRDAFGLSSSAGQDQFKHALAGEPIFACGKVGATNPKNTEDFGDAEPLLQQLIRQLHDAGLLVGYTTNKDGNLMAMNLKEAPADKDGKRPLYVEVGPYKLYDLREVEARNGEGTEWQASVLATDEGRTPWMNVREKEFTYRNGPNKGQPGVNNRGAFLLFMNRQSGSFASDETNPFVIAARELDQGIF